MTDLLFEPRKSKSFFTIITLGDFSKSQTRGAHLMPEGLAEDIQAIKAEDFTVCIEDARNVMKLLRKAFTEGLEQGPLDPQVIKTVVTLDLIHSLCHGFNAILLNWKNFNFWRGSPYWDMNYAKTELRFGQLVKTLGKEHGLTPRIANEAIAASKRAGLVERLAWLEYLGN